MAISEHSAPWRRPHRYKLRHTRECAVGRFRWVRCCQGVLLACHRGPIELDASDDEDTDVEDMRVEDLAPRRIDF